MTRIVLVRHGQTEWNRVERFRGQVDVPLNEIGHRQAQSLARRLASWPIAAIYAGPLGRARETAQPLADALNMPCQVLDGFLDINYGDWAGLSFEQAAARDPETYARWNQHPAYATAPDGEGLADVQQRAIAAVRQVVAAHPDATVVMVGHQVVNKVVICAALDLELDYFWRLGQDNACLNLLDWQNGVFNLTRLNDTCHLADIV